MERFPRTALFTTAGLLIWAADFLFIYIFVALACARGYAHATLLGIGVVPIASIVATALAAAASIAVFVVAARRARTAPEESSNGAFLGSVAVITALLAVIAIVFTGLPGLLLPGCNPVVYSGPA